ncbi:hypothetical protein [Brenneria tiliae]|uniref:hypothetical protein n=1 Tax=Brenneria tiliae TaxID=2914984 RepID=UPI002014FC13|nr:hypothetical protein [Brenneria tiliae]MCL2900101.1 hypothetical protein [Brenneria tiliae]MCL2904412.1 hypothetical protein [Brenneria tiliae]
MIKSIRQVFEHPDVIFDMVKMYIDILLRHVTDEDIKKIQKILLKISSTYAGTILTNQTVAYTVSRAICYNFSFRFSVERIINKYSNFAVMGLGLYGRVQYAAEAAERLKTMNFTYYSVLYAAQLEMLYFIIEPHISKSVYLGGNASTSDRLISIIDELVR